MNIFHEMTDFQIITTLIGAAAHLPGEDPRAWRWATEALALAGAAELPILIEEAEGVRGRITHDTYIYPTEHSCNDARNDLAVSSDAGHDSTFEYLVIYTCSAQYGRWQFATQWVQR